MFYPNFFATTDRLLNNLAQDSLRTEKIWSPAVDILNQQDSVILLAELPGVKKDQVQITVENGVLQLSAEKKTVQEVEDKDSYLRERRYGKFQRSFRLSNDLDPDSVSAQFEDGVLQLTIKRKQSSQVRQISIQ